MLANRWKTKLRAITVIVAFSALIIYGYFQAYDLIMGPVVKIEYPENNQTIEERSFVLYGKTRNVTRINLNDIPIFINTEGEFRERLPLVGHRNIIKIEAWDRFGRNTEIHHTVISTLGPLGIPSQEDMESQRSREENDSDDIENDESLDVMF